jgi:hypothetical protein
MPLGTPLDIGRTGILGSGEEAVFGEAGGGGPLGISILGFVRLAMFRLWRMEYRVSIRGSGTPISWDKRSGDPKYVSTSMGRLAT